MCANKTNRLILKNYIYIYILSTYNYFHKFEMKHDDEDNDDIFLKMRVHHHQMHVHLEHAIEQDITAVSNMPARLDSLILMTTIL